MKIVGSILLSALVFQESESWRFVYAIYKERHPVRYMTVRMDGKDAERYSGDRKVRGLSPDGKLRLYVFKPSGTSQICTCDLDERNETKLTDGKSLDLSPSWTPDGKRIVFQSNRSGKPQVWIMDADGRNPVQLTDHPDGATQPAASPVSEVISYREEHAGQDKLPPSTLKSMDFSGRNSRTLIEKTQMLGQEWAPKGDRLAVSLVQELRILEFPSAKTMKSFKLDEVHKDLYAHAANVMVWRPDGGAIACNIGFLGGRTVGTEIFGDRQLFLLPLEGSSVVIKPEASEYLLPYGWTR